MVILLKKFWHYALVFSIAIVFSFGLFYLFLNPISLSSIIESRLSLATETTNSVSVPLNPFNKLAMQLEAKEKELSQKEAYLKEIEEKIAEKNSLFQNKFLFGLLVVLVILTILILLNFYFDYRRQKKAKDKLLNG